MIMLNQLPLHLSVLSKHKHARPQQAVMEKPKTENAKKKPHERLQRLCDTNGENKTAVTGSMTDKIGKRNRKLSKL